MGPDLLEECRDVLSEMVLASKVEFPRCVIPKDGDMSDIMILGFSDGGDPASSGCVYVRTKRTKPGSNGETHEVRLLASKARVTPGANKDSKKRKSTPRTELAGMQILVRLVTAVLPGFPKKYLPQSIFLATDSECTITALECEDKVLGQWFTNRVAEVDDHLRDWQRCGYKVEPVHHWPGISNIADLATKGKARVGDIGPGSTWQCGPKEASYGMETWPATRDFRRKLPEQEVKLSNKNVESIETRTEHGGNSKVKTESSQGRLIASNVTAAIPTREDKNGSDTKTKKKKRKKVEAEEPIVNDTSANDSIEETENTSKRKIKLSDEKKASVVETITETEEISQQKMKRKIEEKKEKKKRY